MPLPRDRLEQMGKAIQEKETMQEKDNIQIFIDNYFRKVGEDFESTELEQEVIKK